MNFNDRNRIIVRAVLNGQTLRSTGDLFGISPGRVKQIVRHDLFRGMHPRFMKHQPWEHEKPYRPYSLDVARKYKDHWLSVLGDVWEWDDSRSDL